MKFFSFWRSLASFRVRIALNLKNVPADVTFVDLDADAHHADEYRRVNPQMALPSLVLPTYPLVVWLKAVDPASALDTGPLLATRSPLAELVPPVLPIPSLLSCGR